jgi:hypothetical protein
VSNSALSLLQKDSAQALSYGSSARDILCSNVKVFTARRPPISSYCLTGIDLLCRNERLILNRLLPFFLITLSQETQVQGFPTYYLLIPYRLSAWNTAGVTVHSIQVAKWAHFPSFHGIYVIYETQTDLDDRASVS